MNPLILPPPLTEHKAELDGLLFDVGVGLGDVGAAPAEGVCQNWGHFDAVIHEGLEAVVQEVPAERKTRHVINTVRRWTEKLYH